MPMFWKRKVITAKGESSYGTDATPVVGSNAILARNVRIAPLETVRDTLGPRELNFVGSRGDVIAGQYVTISFDVELAGAGATALAAGTAPGFGPLLKACGLASETLSAGTSAVYALVNPGSESSASIYFYMGGRLHKILGALGNVEFEWLRGKVPLMKYSFMGLYTIPSDTSPTAPTLTGFQAPQAFNKVNTTPLTLHSYAGKFSELRMSTGNELVYRNLANSEAIRIVDRNMTGKCVLEDELVGTKDWWTIIKNATTGALALTHGLTAGNIASVAAPAIQLINPSMDADENISMLGLDLLVRPTATGNDEFALTLT